MVSPGCQDQCADEIHLHGRGGGDGLGDALHQKIGNHTCKERSRTQSDQVGLRDGLQGFREGPDAAGAQVHPLDGDFTAADPRLAHHFSTVGQGGLKGDVGRSGRKDAAFHGEHFRGELYRCGKVAGQMCHCGQKQVSKAVALQAAARQETVLKETAEQVFVSGKRHHAVADVAGRQDIKIAPQTPGAAAVVGDGYDRSELNAAFAST